MTIQLPRPYEIEYLYLGLNVDLECMGPEDFPRILRGEQP